MTSEEIVNMKVVLCSSAVLLVVAGLYYGSSHTRQRDARPTAVPGTISNSSQQANEIVEKIQDLKPEVNGQLSAMTLGALVREFSERFTAFKPIDWEASEKITGRWRIVLCYQEGAAKHNEAEWEYNPATGRLCPFETQNAPRFWAPGCEPLDSADPDQRWVTLNNCVRPEG